MRDDNPREKNMKFGVGREKRAFCGFCFAVVVLLTTKWEVGWPARLAKTLVKNVQISAKLASQRARQSKTRHILGVSVKKNFF